MAIPPMLLAQAGAKAGGALMGLAGGLMGKRSRKKAMRRMEKKATETRERFERQAADARSAFRGTQRTIEALKTSSDVQFTQARATAARLQKSALQNRQLARRGGLTPEAQAQMLGMGNMQEYLAERAGRMESVQRLTQMEAGIISKQQEISAEIIKTGAGAESVWNEAQAGLMSQPDEVAAAVAGAGSAMSSFKPKGGWSSAPSVPASNPIVQPDTGINMYNPPGVSASEYSGLNAGQPQAPPGFGGPGSPFEFIAR